LSGVFPHRKTTLTNYFRHSQLYTFITQIFVFFKTPNIEVTGRSVLDLPKN